MISLAASVFTLGIMGDDTTVRVWPFLVTMALDAAFQIYLFYRSEE